MRRLAVGLALVAVGAAAAPARGDGPLATLAAAVADAETALRQGERELAESRFRDVLGEGWLLVASLELAAGDLGGAAEALERARGAVADTRRADVARALLHLRRGEAGHALPILRRRVAEDPDVPALRRLLAQALVADGQLAEAVQELEEAHRRFPDDGETTFALATGHLRTGDVERADEAFAALTEQAPGAATWVLVGRSYRDHRHTERARRALERAIALDPDARRAHYYRGMVELQARGYDGLETAVAHFERELRNQPDDPPTHLNLGIARAELRRCDEAMPSLARAAEFPATAVEAHRFLGKCHLTAGHPSDAVASFRRGLQLAGDDARPRQLESLHYQLAVALQRLGDPAAAEHFAAAERLAADLVAADRDRLASFLELTAAEPTQAELLPPIASEDWARGLDAAQRADLAARLDVALARASMNLGTLAAEDAPGSGPARAAAMGRAADLYAAAAAIAPELPGIHRALGLASFEAGRYPEAAAALSRALEAAPGGDPDLARRLALASLEAGDPARAARLLAADPGRDDDPALQYAYATALVRSEQAAAAAAAFERLLAAHPEWPELHVLLARASAQGDDFEAAIAAVRRALELDPEVAGAHAVVGDIHLRQGRLAAAQEELRRELAVRPGDVDTRYRLAVALDLDRQPDAALGELDRVLRERPGFADARYLAGKIHLAEGRPADAVAHLEAAARQAPEDANVRYQLGQAYQRLGDEERAATELARYRELKRAERADHEGDGG